jgi:hypothetical protein
VSQNFSAQDVKRRQYPGYLAKFHNAALENSGRKATAHNLFRGSLRFIKDKQAERCMNSKRAVHIIAEQTVHLPSLALRINNGVNCYFK